METSEGALPLLPGGWTSYQFFLRDGLDRTSAFRGGLLEKSRLTFFTGVVIKKNLKSEIFNDTNKIYKQIYFSLVTKNSNWNFI